MDPGELARGIALFNRSEFFEAHEVLEDIWRAAPIEEKKICQGLVQTAVAFHHFSTGNRVGMRSVMERAMKNMAACPADFHGVCIEPLLQSLADWLSAVDNEHDLPPLPRIEIVPADGGLK